MTGSDLSQAVRDLGLVDLLVVALVVISVLGALRGRRGILAAAASGIGTALVCWLAAGAVLAWAPPSWQAPVAHSALVQLVGPPVSALEQAGQIGSRLVGELADGSGPSSTGRG